MEYTKEMWRDKSFNIVNYKASLQHKGWMHSYNGMDITSNLPKEEAFMEAIKEFQLKFGEWNVIEDDIMFNPIFK